MFKYFALFLIILFAACTEQKSIEKESNPNELNKTFGDIVKKYDNSFTETPSIITEKFMYVNGFRMAQNMMKDSLHLSLDAFLQGFVDAIKKENIKIPIDSMDAVLYAFSEFMSVRTDSLNKLQEIENAVLRVRNLEEADKFLEENSKKDGIVSLPSRLQYKIIKEGTGKIPTVKDAVLVHMTSTFADGTVFDDTRGGEPRAIPNEKMIPGWLEGITKMKEGSRWVLYMHPTLAFGESGMDGKVPPNKLTIVDVELVKVMTPEEVAEFLKKNPPKPPLPGGSIKGM